MPSPSKMTDNIKYYNRTITTYYILHTYNYDVNAHASEDKKIVLRGIEKRCKKL